VILNRLDLTEKLMANLERENELAKEMGYGSRGGDETNYNKNININSRVDPGVDGFQDPFSIERLSTPDTALYYSPH
jgi:hypothetical protein